MLFAKGMLLGLSIAAPVGPIGLLCIRRTIYQGRVAGFVSGLGAAAADFVYALAAAAGFAAVFGPITRVETLLRIGGGIVLLAIGAKVLLEGPPEHSATTKTASLPRCFAGTFALTIANPVTVLSFVAMYASLGVAGPGSSLVVATGVLIGSAVWWLTLSGIAGYGRNRISPRALRAISYTAGIVIAGFGIVAILKR